MTITKKSFKDIKIRRGRVDQKILDRTTEADIERHAAEDGAHPDAEWWPSAAAARARLGTTQADTATLLHIPVSTWRNWEQGRTIPDPAGRALLRLIYLQPEAVRQAFTSQAA